MKNYTSNKKKKSKIVILAMVLCLGTLSVISGLNLNTTTPPAISEIEIQQNGVNIRFLKSYTNDDGSVTKVFTFTITPDNATIQTVSAKINYANEEQEDCQDVMTIEVDNTKKEILLTNKKAFSTQIIATISSTDDETKSATITCDYVKKLLSIDKKTNKTFVIGNNWSSGTNIESINDFNASNFINASYSIFTKDKDYHYSTNTDNNLIASYNYVKGFNINNQVILLAYNNFLKVLNTKIQNNDVIFTKDDIWGLNDNNEWHSLLKKASTEQPENYYFGYALNTTVKCDEDTTKSIKVTNLIKCSFAFDYSDYKINVDSLNVETSNVDF